MDVSQGVTENHLSITADLHYMGPRYTTHFTSGAESQTDLQAKDNGFHDYEAWKQATEHKVSSDYIVNSDEVQFIH